MTKYFISRVLLLFIVSFFIGWALHVWQTDQLYNFFYMNFWTIFKLVVAAILLIIGVIVLNLTLTLLYWKEFLLSNFIVKNDEVKNKYFSIFCLLVFDYRFSIIQFAFNYEKQRERYPVLFCVFVFICSYSIFFKGIPLINNYYAFYFIMEEEDRRGMPLIEKVPYIVVQKDSLKIIENEIRKTMPSFVEDVKYKGYVFLQAALIDGYWTYQDYEGIAAYFGCLPYYALEKLIRVLLLFLFPFMVVVFVSEKVYEKNGVNENKFESTTYELIRKVKDIEDTMNIIQKYNFNKTPHIHDALLTYKKGVNEGKLKKILDKKNWFDAQALLFILNSYYTLIPWTERLLAKKTFDIIKNNFDNFHFSDKYDKNPIERAKEYITQLEENKYLSANGTFYCLLNLIPEYEIDIDRKDFWELDRIKSNWK
jgi:hypothetical protein